MYLLIVGLTIIAGVAIGWSIGANDAANSLGTAVGCKILTLRQAILLIVVFGLLGALLQGGHVVKTIAKGIIQIEEINAIDKTLGAEIALVATFAACIWVIIATFMKMPVSTSHSMVGAVAGVGWALHEPVQSEALKKIFICWIATPFGAALIGYILYRVLAFVVPRILPPRFERRVMTALIVVSGCYVAFSWGANDVANATGVIRGAEILSANQTLMLGGLAIILGVITFGYKVIETVGSQITTLLPLMAFSAQLASALNVHFYTLLGMPVSTSHSIVGAIFGVGLVKGMKVVNFRILREIAICWVATPFVSGIVSFVMMKAVVAFAR